MFDFGKALLELPQLAFLQARGGTILAGKLGAKSWGGKARLRASRYSPAALRLIRKQGQARECARRRRKMGAGA